MNLENFIYDFLFTTQSAAFAASNAAGRFDSKNADKVSVDAMRKSIDKIDAKVNIAIGEGERDKAPMLYIGEMLGVGKEKLDVAVDPLEGTDLCANLKEGALSVLGFAKSGAILNAPDLYMQKIFTNCDCNISLDNDLENNLKIIAVAKKKRVEDLTITVLNRTRHKKILDCIKSVGARVKLIEDGDIAAILSIIIDKKEDVYIGIGGAPEGVLAAIAAKNLGGKMLCKLVFETEEEKMRAKSMGISDLNKVYSPKDMIKDNSVFVATGVTDGSLLKGVTVDEEFVNGQSLVITQKGYFKSYFVYKKSAMQ